MKPLTQKEIVEMAGAVRGVQAIASTLQGMLTSTEDGFVVHVEDVHPHLQVIKVSLQSIADRLEDVYSDEGGRTTAEERVAKYEGRIAALETKVIGLEQAHKLTHRDKP